MFYFLYNIILLFYAIWGVFYSLYKKKGIKSLWLRIRPLPISKKKAGEVIVWLHAVSFGEMRAATALIKRFQKEKVRLIVSTCSMTGYQEAQKLSTEAFFLPFDLTWLIAPFVRAIKPDLLVMVEGDVWPQLQKSVKKWGGKIVVVNAKISERSFRRLLHFPKVARELYGRVDHFLLQSEIYKERFLNLKIDKDKLEVVGNIKLDNPMNLLSLEEKEALRKQFFLTPQDFVFTIASTHDPEESLWIEALSSLWVRFPHLKIFLVPRHPERTAFVASLLKKKAISFTQVSEGGSFAQGRLILVDQMGLLLKLYQLSDLAFVGGSYTPKVGGHNIMEPAFYGLCTLYGPYLHSQPGFAAMMKEAEAGVQITIEEMEKTVGHLIETPALLKAYGERGRSMVLASRGALEKNWQKLQELLPIKSVL